MSIKNTKLGVLVGMPVHSFPTPSAELVLPSAKVGIEVELERWDGLHVPEMFWTRQTEDHSLRNHGQEFVTRGGMIGNNIRAAVEEIFDMAKRFGWDVGYPRAGIHIHLDVTDLNTEPNELAVLVSNYLMVEHMMFGFAGVHRRWTGYSVAMEDGQFDFGTLGQVLFGNQPSKDLVSKLKALSKYQALNLNPLVRFGTIEFRHLPTTFDVERVMLWINTILAIKLSASNPALASPLKTMSAVGPEKMCQMIFGAKIFDKFKQWFNPNSVWTAVDNATAMMALGGTIKTTSFGWKDAPEASPLIKQKLGMMTPTEEVKKPAAPRKTPAQVAAEREIAARRRLDDLRRRAGLPEGWR